MKMVVWFCLFCATPVFAAEETQHDIRNKLAEATLQLHLLETERAKLDAQIRSVKTQIGTLTQNYLGAEGDSGKQRFIEPSKVPDMTRAEWGAFILAIGRCWNVGALSTDALKVTVTVGFTMTPDAKPEIGSINLVRAEGGSGGAVDRAYEAARRAIIRCGASGFGLPPEKYSLWRGVEVRFNASTKEIR